jgi:predicted rRNA methylase YqxC with S4 and FtsJ domains
MGVNGSIKAVSAKHILDSLRVNGKVVCDLGAADATFMFCAFLAGAQRVFGVEFADKYRVPDGF